MTITYGDVRANITTRHQEKPSGLEIVLQPSAVISLHARRGETVIKCDSGMLWITQQGDPMDYFLQAGDTFRPRRPGILVVQAMGESAASITE